MELAQSIVNLDGQFRAWADGLGFPAEAILRLLLAAAVGGLVGIEREVRGRQAGFRTNLLVCVGSALVMIVSIQFANRQWNHSPSFNINIDPARIAYGVMTGVGFLGAGTIVHHGTSVRGLTTAAGLWCVAALGLAAGFGLYMLTFVSCAIVVLGLWLLDYVGRVLPQARYHTIVVRRKFEPGCVERTADWFKQKKCGKIHVMGFHRSGDMQTIDIRIMITAYGTANYHTLIQKLENEQQMEVMSTEES